MKKIIALLHIIIFVLFLGCSIIDFEGGKNKIEMPNVVGQSYSSAYKQLSNAGFTHIEANRAQVSLDNGDEWIVSAQSEAEGTQVSSAKKIVLSCIQSTKVYFEIKSDDNIMFSTYDVIVQLDDITIARIPDGETKTLYMDLMEGEHVLRAYNAENSDISTSITIKIEGETYYYCEIKHTKDKVKIKGIKQTNETIVPFLKVIDVQGLPLDQAKALLKDVGFVNVSAIDSEKKDSILRPEDYFVTSQNMPAGQIIERNDPIILYCASIYDYCRKTLNGKSILDAEKILSESKFAFAFHGDNGTIIDTSKMTDEEKKLWIIGETYRAQDKGVSFSVKKYRIATMFDLHYSAKVYQTIRASATEHYLINPSNHLIVVWTSSEKYTWGYYIGDLDGLFYLVTGIGCGKCKGSSSSFTHYGEKLSDKPVVFTAGKLTDCEDRYEDIVASRPSDMSNYTEVHAHINGGMLLIRSSDYSSVIAAGKKLGWKVESNETIQSTGEAECVMNTGKDGLIVRIRYSPTTKEISSFTIQEYDKHASLDRKRAIAIAIATAICSPEDTDAVKTWVTNNFSASSTSETLIHGVPYFLGHNFNGDFIFFGGFYEE